MSIPPPRPPCACTLCRYPPAARRHEPARVAVSGATEATRVNILHTDLFVCNMARRVDMSKKKKKPSLSPSPACRLPASVLACCRAADRSKGLKQIEIPTSISPQDWVRSVRSNFQADCCSAAGGLCGPDGLRGGFPDEVLSLLLHAAGERASPRAQARRRPIRASYDCEMHDGALPQPWVEGCSAWLDGFFPFFASLPGGF